MARAGLRVRLLAGTVLVAAGAVAATAWLAVQGTTGSIAEQQGMVDQVSGQAYSAMVDYAATHADWHAVQPTLAQLSAYTGTRVVLTPVGGAPISSAAGSDGAPAGPSVQVDPLAVDNSVGGTQFPDGIDPVVAGPFQLTTQEHADLEARIEGDLDCLRDGTIAEVPSGRPYLRLDRGQESSPCLKILADAGWPIGYQDTPRVTPTPTEQAALDRITQAMKDCLPPEKDATVVVDARGEVRPVAGKQDPQVGKCLVDARRQVLRPYVAPIAHLQVTAMESSPQAGIGLSSGGLLRIAGVTAIVLVLTVGVAMLLANRVIQPVRTLTAATRRMRAGDGSARARVRARWEIAELAGAFNEMAEHAARTEGQRRELISDVSHELRTPLGTIRGWLVAAQDGLADLDDELVTSLLQETSLLQHLVDDLRDLALADAGMLRLERVELNATELLRHVAAAHGGRVEADVPDDLLVTADPVRLRQIVGNLLANAVRHTPPGGRIVLAGRRDGRDVLITVTDTGAGIAADDLAHVFDRFWRADKSRTRRTGGSGLGLAIVRKLAEAQGGEVTVTSAPGEGSAFTLRLPAPADR
ncbi:sensor histidine kinase [Amycolatopsis saalfeldensis]|uniref:histidine kinase n=1 Tax=Amycolatopsis saalfeldensis TaxID=394193 RepID=A0A1H8YA44_9PSEU|nr:ATP-binding protein [Amycolatopsis saalfeldensis]SEP48967.1 two-component system, OmpR family, sensor histidine kinase BaeS [Amycolatopsis saalfeldensis]